MTDLAEYFNDPFDPPRSLQLNNRHWPDEQFQHLDLLRDAEDDLVNRRTTSLRRKLKHVKALLPESYRSKFLSRLVYSVMYTVAFAPMRFSVGLSDEFIRANRYEGPAHENQASGRQTEELKYLVDLVHGIYRQHYGVDILSSAFAVRYMNATNPEAARRMTEHGELSDYHMDEGKDFTCILYLSPVQRDNGCFTYIDRSYAVRKSHILRALHQVVDFDMLLPRPEQRTHLPLEVRGSIGIGDYLDDDKREIVRSAAVDVIGGVGEGVIFNGFDTLHRGGKPLVGERTALFISTRGHVSGRAKQLAYNGLARLLV